MPEIKRDRSPEAERVLNDFYALLSNDLGNPDDKFARNWIQNHLALAMMDSSEGVYFAQVILRLIGEIP